MTDADYILQAISQARLGLGKTWPNPLVGAVIVKDGRIIGQGYHQSYGNHHAEVDALNNCTESPEGATIYVNLEPCCHTNKQTPPCAQRLVQEKLKKVVIANLDPNPAVNGKGVELLRANGIEVVAGIEKEQGEKLNEVFFHAQKNKTPFIHLKLATSLDGKIALSNGESKWITGETSRFAVHQLRSHHQGVIIGAQTLRDDNPKLNVRIPDYRGKQPFRIIFTESGKLPQSAEVFNDVLKNQTLIYTQKNISFSHPKENVIIVSSLQEAMSDLFERKMINLFLEGGAHLTTAFLKERLVNRVSLFMNPSFIGEGKFSIGDLGLKTLTDRLKLNELESTWTGEDLYLTGRLF